MLNRLDQMTAALSADARREAEARVWEEFQARIAQSHRLPYSLFARAVLVVYLTALLAAGAVARIVGRQRPGPMVRRLAAHYAALPEMVLHKAIELHSLSSVPFSGRGLDLGCGDGIVGGVLIEAASLDALEGVDVSPVAEENVRARGYAAYTVSDIRKLPFPDAKFDYLISICVVEHVPDLDRVLAEASRVLRPGGRFWFTTPSPSFHEGLIAYRLLRALGATQCAERFRVFKDLSSMQHHYLDADGWRRRLASHGFDEVSVKPLFTRNQLSAYDLLNFQIYVPRLFFYEHLCRWVTRWPGLRRMTAWASAELCGWLSAHTASEDDHTHFNVGCRKAPAE